MSKIDLSTYEQDPSNPSEILNIAGHCAEQGQHDSAMLFAESVYRMNNLSNEVKVQALERFAISGFYSKIPSRKLLGKQACELLAMNKDINWNTRYVAGQNSTWYASSSNELFSNTVLKHLDFTPPDDYLPLNPSIYRWGNQLWMIQRTVNYVITPSGHYDMRGDTAIRTRNWLLKLNSDLTVHSAREILPPVDLPEPLYNLVIGFEDNRLFVWQDQLWCTSTVRELNQPGNCEIVLSRIDDTEDGKCRYSNWRVIHPKGVEFQHQKNWMPVVINQDLRFIYSSDPVRIIDDQGEIVMQHEAVDATDSFRGGSQAIRFNNGWLAIIHESHMMPDQRRRYMHRFVWYNENFDLAAYTPAFYIAKLGIEFAAGIAEHPLTNKIIVSFGLADNESWLAEFEPVSILAALKYIKRKESN